MAPFNHGSQVLIAWIITLACVSANVNDCPLTCFCDKKPFQSIPGGFGLKINCHPSVSESISRFNIKLPTSTVQLDLSNYGLKEILSETFAGLVHLQKLDLQGNSIETINNGAFANLPKLEFLDLSRNSLEKVQRSTFAGLVSIKRLKINGNNIQTLEEGSFQSLRFLEKVITNRCLKYYNSFAKLKLFVFSWTYQTILCCATVKSLG